MTCTIGAADTADSARLHGWFIREWGQVDKFAMIAGNLANPLVARHDKDGLIGGLAFTLAAHPSRSGQFCWINALYVVPHWRQQGVATQLVIHAQQHAAGAGIEELFVYTAVPALYEGLGWQKTPGQSDPALGNTSSWVLGYRLT